MHLAHRRPDPVAATLAQSAACLLPLRWLRLVWAASTTPPLLDLSCALNADLGCVSRTLRCPTVRPPPYAGSTIRVSPRAPQGVSLVCIACMFADGGRPRGATMPVVVAAVLALLLCLLAEPVLRYSYSVDVVADTIAFACLWPALRGTSHGVQMEVVPTTGRWNWRNLPQWLPLAPLSDGEVATVVVAFALLWLLARLVLSAVGDLASVTIEGGTVALLLLTVTLSRHGAHEKQ